MTAPDQPRVSGPMLLVKGRHGRTVFGLAMMGAAVAFVLVPPILKALLHEAAPTCPTVAGAVTTWAAVAQAWLFPVLLLVGGYRLFGRRPLNGLLRGRKSFRPAR